MKGFSSFKERVANMNLAQKLIGGFGLLCAFIMLNAILTIAIHF